MKDASDSPETFRERVGRWVSLVRSDVVDPLEAFLEGLPVTAWLLVAGILLVALGFALESMGLAVEAGLSGAIALFFVGSAVIGQLVIWGFGLLDRGPDMRKAVRDRL